MSMSEFERIGSFLSGSPSLDVRTLDLLLQSDELDQQLAAFGTDRPALARYQRLLRLLPAAVDPDQTQDSDEAAIRVLCKAHFGSAHDIAALPESAFVARVCADLPGGRAQALAIHQNAGRTTQWLTHLALTVRGLVGSAHARAQPSHHAAGTLLDYFEQIPSYQQMFGSLDYCNCAQCQSIFGPAAYLVDLLRIIDTYVVPENTIAPDYRLAMRRPDLYTTPLDCAATLDPVPYLALVDTLLAAQIQTRTGEDAWHVVAAAVYPFNVPFSLPQTQVRAYLDQLGSTLSAVYGAFLTPPPAVSVVNALSLARESLLMSIEQFAVVSTARTTEAALAPYYGYSDAVPIAELSQVAVFLRRCGLQRDQLVELLTQGLSHAEREAGVADGFFINATDEGLPAMTLVYREVGGELLEHIAEVSLLRLDRLNRFIRLQAHTQLSAADLQWALFGTGSSAIDETALISLADLLRLSRATSVGAIDLLSLWTDLKTDGRGNGRYPADPFDRVFNAPALLGGKDPYTSAVIIPFDPARPMDWMVASTDPTNSTLRGRLSAALSLSSDDVTTLGVYLLGLLGGTAGALRTDLTTLSWMNRLSRAARLLKVNLDTLLRLLALLFYPNQSWRAPAVGAWAASQAQINRLLSTAAWVSKSTLSVQELQYILTGEVGPQVRLSYRPSDIGAWLDVLALTAADEYVVADDLVFGNISQDLAQRVRNDLIAGGFITVLGLVLAKKAGFAALTPLLPIHEDAFFHKGGVLSIAESTQAFGDLVAHQLITAALGATEGALSDTYTSATPLDFLFDGDPDAPTKRDQVRQVLVAFRSDIDHLVGVLATASSGQQIVAVGGLASLLGSTAEHVTLLIALASSKAMLPDWCATLLTPRPTGIVPAGVDALIQVLARYLRLATLLPLDLTQIAALVASPANFDIADLQNLTLDNVRSLTGFVDLEETFHDPDNALVRCYFGTVPDSGCVGRKTDILARLSGWPPGQIDWLIALLWPGSSDVPPPSQTVGGLELLQRIFSLSQQLGMDVQTLEALAQLSHLGVLDPEGQLVPAAWARWTELAQSTLAALAAAHPDDFAQVFEDVECALVSAQRDALLGYTVWLLEAAGLPIRNANGLFNYFLIDVETSGCDRTSWVAQAIQSAQLYLQRARLQQEPGVQRIPVPAIWWTWLSEYRVWEANRRIFVYPENYVDPELLSNSSPIFTGFAEDLRQNDITDTTVAAAYTQYFDQFSVAASLVHSSALRESQVDPGSGEGTDTLFLVGRSLTAPYNYHLRRFIAGRRWTPWTLIGVNIAARSVAPAYAFGRLLIFWSETEATHSSAVSGGTADAQSTVFATLKYSFQNTAGAWVQPQVLYANYVINAEPVSYSPMHQAPIAALFNSDLPGWLTPQVLRIGNGIPAQGRISIVKGLTAAFGNNTNFGNEIRPGDRLWVAGQERTVIVVDGGQLGVSDAWTLTVSDSEFKVIPADPSQAGYRSFPGAGKISFVAGLQVASGVGTEFSEQIEVGDRISALGETRTVLQVVVSGGSQQLLLDFAWGVGSGEQVDYTISPMSSGEDRLLVLYGSGLNTAQRIPDPDSPVVIDNPGRDPYTSALNEFNRDLYQTLVLADRIDSFVAPGTNAAPAGAVTAGLAIQLTADLVPNVGRGLLLGYTYSADYTQLANLTPYTPYLDRNNDILSIIPGTDVIADALWGNVQPRPQFRSAPLAAALPTSVSSLPLLYNVPDDISSVHNVVNQTGWFVFGSGAESYLVQSQQAGLIDTSRLTFVRPYLTSGVYRHELAISAGPYTTSPVPFDQLSFRFTRISTSVAGRLGAILLARGLDGLLRLDTQYLPEAPFSHFYSDATGQPAPAIDAVALPTALMDFNGAYGQYFWEVFFYAPFLIARRLAGHQRFAEAAKWYQYLFNPTQPPEADLPNPSDRYWRFRPFRPLTVQSLAISLSNVEQIDVYNDDPFDPDAIARLRPGAYPKAIFIRYVENLLDSGDHQFRVDTRESISAATNLYLMASELLGARPRAVGECAQPLPRSYAQMQAAYDTHGTAAGATASTLILDQNASSHDRFYSGLWVEITQGPGVGQRRTIVDYAGANRTATVTPDWQTLPSDASGYRISSTPQFLIDLENGPVHVAALAGPGVQALPYNLLGSYFCVPDNAELIGLWDRLDDRLFKIRHCMNIEGVVRALPLFAAPIDPRDLVRAAAAGGYGGASDSSLASAPVSPYRFEFLITQAQSVTGSVIQFGQSLLLALEKRDAEALALLQNTQTDALLELTRAMKLNAVTEAERQWQALQVGLQSAQWRQQFYQDLMQSGLSAGEQQNLDAMAAGLAFNILATVTKSAASVAFALPNVGSPFAMTYGGQQIGHALNAASGVFEVGSQISSYIAQRSITVAGYDRRAQDWGLQEKLAAYEGQQTTQLVDAAALRIEMARQDLRLLDEQVRQNQTLGKMLQQKFTNVQLYEWLVRQLSGLYLQLYQVAHESAQAAQRAYEYRLGTGRNFIRNSTWDSLHKGLLAGEGLSVALNQLERAWLDENRRRFEIVKTIALSQLDPTQLLQLRETGTCVFSLSELLFDQDYPGHYARTISSVTLSLPAVLGPYQNLKATLTQLGNQVVIEPNIEAITFLAAGTGAGSFPPRALRSDWRAQQQVVLSRGLDDSGLFQLDPGDPRFLPFEGTGAVSTWQLSLPPQTNRFDFATISDVVLQLRYTALDGGPSLRKAVVEIPELSVYSGASLLLLRQTYPQPWHVFMTVHADPAWQVLSFRVSPGTVPAHVSAPQVPGFYLQLLLAEGVGVPPGSQFLTLKLGAGDAVPITLDANAAALVTLPQPVEFAALLTQPLQLEFTLATTPADLKQQGYLDPLKVIGIGLILDIAGTIDW